MRKILLASLAAIVVILFAGCGRTGLNNLNEQNPVLDRIPSKLGIVSMQSYEITLPMEINIKKEAGDTLVFEKGGKSIGGVEVLGYSKDQPLSTVFPNHAEIVSQEKLNDFKNTYKVVLKQGDTAASGKENTIDRVHYYILDNNKAYDIFYDKDLISDDAGLNIAKSFKLVPQFEDIDISKFSQGAEDYKQRFSYENGLAALNNVTKYLDSFRQLTDKIKTKLSESELKDIGNMSWEIQHLAFANIPKAAEGTIRRQQFEIKKLQFELAQKQLALKEITEDEFNRISGDYRKSKQEFQRYIDNFMVAD